MIQIITDTDTQLHVGLSESTGVVKDKFVCLVMSDETGDDDIQLFTHLTVGQTKELIKILQKKVASIERLN